MDDIKTLVVITTLIFLIAPAFIVMFVIIYNQRKKKYIEEKKLMQVTFEAELIKTQLEVQEQTMQTIGADLHDNIGQLLSLTSLTLNSIALDNPEKSQQKIEAAIDLTRRSIKEMRLLGKLLQGDQLIASGLHEAIGQEVNWLARNSHYEINYARESETPAGNNPDKDLIIFRIVQELLNNIIKHAQATKINIKLEYVNNAISLIINDNGIGFNVNDTAANGMGLHNISKRVGIIGGNVNITSGSGTSISVSIPYP